MKEPHDSDGKFHYYWNLDKWTIKPNGVSINNIREWDVNSNGEDSATRYSTNNRVKAYGNLWKASQSIAIRSTPPGINEYWIPYVEILSDRDKEKILSVKDINTQLYQTVNLRDNKKYTLSGYVRSTEENKTFKLILGSSGNECEVVYSNLDDNNLYYDSEDATSTTVNTIPKQWTFEDSEWHYFRCTFMTPGETSSTFRDLDIGFTCNSPFEIWHAQLEQGEIASAWSPSPEDVDDNTVSTTGKYDQNLAQDQIFDKLFKDPVTGLKADGISLVPADKSISGIPELYINASYISTGILRSKNWDGKIKGKFNRETGESDYTISSNPRFGMYIDLNQGKVWAAKFELNAWDYDNSTLEEKGKGLYLNSDPVAPSGNGTLQAHSYYLKLGDLSNDYITFDVNGNLKVKIKKGIIDAETFVLDAWKNTSETDTSKRGIYLNSKPTNSDSSYYFRVGNANNYITFSGSGKLNINITDGLINAKKFILDAWTTSNSVSSGIYLNSNPSSGGYYFRVGKSNASYITFAQNGTLNIVASNFNLSAGSTDSKRIQINSSASTTPLLIGTKFKVGWDGTLDATGASFSGTVTGSTISGSTIYAKTLYAGGNGTSTTSSDYILRATSTAVTISGATISGSTTNGPSYTLSSAGQLTAKSAILTTLTVKDTLTVAKNGTTGGHITLAGDINLSGNIKVATSSVIYNGAAVNSSTEKISFASNGIFITGKFIDLGAEEVEIGASARTAETGKASNVEVWGDMQTFGNLTTSYNVYFKGNILAHNGKQYRQGITSNYKVETGWFSSKTLVFYKGLLVDVLKKDGTSDTSSNPGATLAENLIPTFASTDKNKVLAVNDKGDTLLWKALGATLVNFTDGTTVSGPYTSGTNKYYNVSVSYSKTGNVTAEGEVSGTVGAVWLGWDVNSEGRIYSREYDSESEAKEHKYYTRCSSRSYSKEYSKKVPYTVSGTTVGSVQIVIS